MPTFNGSFTGRGQTISGTDVDASGTVFIQERADAQGDEAGKGQLWVDNQTPCELYFTTDAGNDIQITSGTSVAGAATAVSMTNGSNNRIATATGAAALNGEANLTFDGTTLLVDSDVTATTNHTTVGAHIDYDATGIIASGQTGNNVGLDLDINSDSPTMVGTVNNTGLDIDLTGGTSGAQTNIGIDVNVSGADTNYAAVFNGGNVGIGTSAPSQILQVAASAPILVVQNTTNEHTDGGAESKVLFGDHAGNALSLVEGAHSGSSDDAKGQFRVSTNNGSGTQLAMSIDDSQITTFSANVVVGGTTPKITIGDAGAEDTMLVFDGNAQDYRIGLDDGTDTLEIGHGTSHGANTAITIDNSGQVTKFNIPAAAVAQASDHIIFLDGGATGAPKAESIDDFLTAIAGSGISVSSSQLTASGGGSAADDANTILHMQVFA